MSVGKAFDQFYSEMTIPEPNSGCYLWLGRVYESTGYGQVSWNGRSYSAHRWSYENWNGPIPSGLVVRHRCDNKLCVNPEHLLTGTQKQNIHDQWARGRNAPKWKLGSPGERNPAAKLTEASVRAIRLDERSPRLLAAQYGVCRSTISHIRNRRIWKHVT